MRDYTITINVNFPNPLVVVLRVETDAAEVNRLADKLHTSTGSLKEAVSKASSDIYAELPKP